MDLGDPGVRAIRDRGDFGGRGRGRGLGRAVGITPRRGPAPTDDDCETPPDKELFLGDMGNCLKKTQGGSLRLVDISRTTSGT